jgi:hypothetical protein
MAYGLLALLTRTYGGGTSRPFRGFTPCRKHFATLLLFQLLLMLDLCAHALFLGAQRRSRLVSACLGERGGCPYLLLKRIKLCGPPWCCGRVPPDMECRSTDAAMEGEHDENAPAGSWSATLPPLLNDGTFPELCLLRCNMLSYCRSLRGSHSRFRCEFGISAPGR